MSSVEPLQLLRDYIREKKEIKLVDDKLAFGSKQLDVTLPTAWHPKSREGKEPYKLGELWLFLKNVLIKPTEGTNSYYSDVNDIGKKLKLGIISIPHQDEILKYFRGEIETSEDIKQGLNTHIKSKDLLAKRSKPNGVHAEENLPPLKFLISSSNGTIIELIKEPNLSLNIPPLEAIAKRERASETKNGRLRTGKSFKFCIDLLEATGAKQPDKKDKSYLTVLQEIKGNSSSGFEESRPIIVVPNAPHQGNLCLLNAVEFLKNGTYKSPEQISKKAEDKYDTKVTFTTQINDEDVTFEVTSDPSNLKASNKLYPPFTQRPRRRHFPPLRQPLPVQNLRENIRRRKHREALEAMYARLTPVRGYVMKYSDVTLNETIKGWNTKLLNVGLADADRATPAPQRRDGEAGVLGRYDAIPQQSAVIWSSVWSGSLGSAVDVLINSATNAWPTPV